MIKKNIYNGDVKITPADHNKWKNKLSQDDKYTIKY
mgnify:CR=1 FL=1